MNLRQWQTSLVNSTITGKADAMLLQQLVGQLPRLAIYQNNVKQGLKSALKISYPASAWLMGKVEFEQLADAYRDEFTPKEVNLNHYGKQLSQYLEQSEKLGNYPYLVDLTKLEWARQESYYAADDAPMDSISLNALASVEVAKQGDVIFELRANMQLISSYFDLAQLWQYYSENKTSSNTRPIVIKKQQRRLYFCIHRAEYQATVMTLNEADFIFLTAMQQQKTLAEMVQAETVANIDNCLPRYITEGYIKGFYIKATGDERA